MSLVNSWVCLATFVACERSTDCDTVLKLHVYKYIYRFVAITGEGRFLFILFAAVIFISFSE